MKLTIEKIYSNTNTLSEPCKVYEGLVGTNQHPSATYQGKNRHLHVIAWMVVNGNEPPKNFELHHLCFNKRCLNVNHLILLSHTEHYNIHQFKNKIRIDIGQNLKPDATTTLANLFR